VPGPSLAPCRRHPFQAWTARQGCTPKLNRRTILNLSNQLVCAACIVFCFACGKKDRPATEPDSVKVPAATGAREAITSSRCHREQRCDNIGEGKKFSSSGDCSDRINAEWKDDLNARECPNGVNQQQLDECLTAIKNEDCGNPFDKLERVSACTVGQLCLN
jgi:hypothetical protein